MIPSLPDYIFINDVGLQKSYVDNLVVSETEVGPFKTRPKQSKPLQKINIVVSTDKDNLSAFDIWYHQTIRSGSSWFTIKNPFKNETLRCKFANREFSWDKEGTLLTSVFELEAFDVV